ncbi:hypothetical protein FRAAL1407 [Frankia alni ACN14a]|uniref:Uncharacterized protein n=1 Tax=Frankia alni (strain DSM 45986 / CECT 9034 / ACN14a) TaxID=326424 RepID=Q0RQV8_FRAAA|nr:hypothetical protein FRAAL1407 [Frankia alni ACN14a]
MLPGNLHQLDRKVREWPPIGGDDRNHTAAAVGAERRGRLLLTVVGPEVCAVSAVVGRSCLHRPATGGDADGRARRSRALGWSSRMFVSADTVDIGLGGRMCADLEGFTPRSRFCNQQFPAVREDPGWTAPFTSVRSEGGILPYRRHCPP